MGDTQLFNAGECEQVLQRFLQTPSVHPSSFKILNFHNPFQGLVGEHFTLRIEYTHQHQPESQDFFVKTLSTNPLLLSFCKTLQVYEKEAFLYNLLDELNRYNIDISFAPRGLFFKPYVIVLVDVSRDFRGTPKRRLLDLEHSRRCLGAVANFHASCLNYERRKSEQLGRKFLLTDDNSKILEDKFATEEETIATKWIRCAIEGLFHLIDLIPENHVTHKAFKGKLSELLIAGRGDSGVISGVLHGDLWSSNFLHSYEGKKPVRTILLDFQMLKYGPLESDVVEFLMTSVDRELRKRNFRDLVEDYYGDLQAAVEGDLPSTDEFVRSCENFQIAGMVHAVVDHSYTYMEDKVFEDVLKSDESFKTFLFEDRGKYLVESYNNNEEYKEVLRDDLVELRDLLFA